MNALISPYVEMVIVLIRLDLIHVHVRMVINLQMERVLVSCISFLYQ